MKCTKAFYEFKLCFLMKVNFPICMVHFFAGKVLVFAAAVVVVNCGCGSVVSGGSSDGYNGAGAGGDGDC